jgi:hypothetical protein
MPQDQFVQAVGSVPNIIFNDGQPSGAWSSLPIGAGDTATKAEALLDPQVDPQDQQLYADQVSGRLKNALESEYEVYARSLDEVIDDIAVSETDRTFYSETYNTSHMPPDKKTFELDPQTDPRAWDYSEWLYSEA